MLRFGVPKRQAERHFWACKTSVPYSGLWSALLWSLNRGKCWVATKSSWTGPMHGSAAVFPSHLGSSHLMSSKIWDHFSTASFDTSSGIQEHFESLFLSANSQSTLKAWHSPWFHSFGVLPRQSKWASFDTNRYKQITWRYKYSEVGVFVTN